MIKLHSNNQEVKDWQTFLTKLGYPNIVADGIFGNLTQQATIDFQKKQGLTADGAVGPNTYAKAKAAGYKGSFA